LKVPRSIKISKKGQFVVSAVPWLALKLGLELVFTGTNKNAKNASVCNSAPETACVPVDTIQFTVNI